MANPRPGGRAYRYAIDELARLFQETGIETADAKRLARQYAETFGVGRGRGIQETQARELAKAVAKLTPSKVKPVLESLGALSLEPIKAENLLASTSEPIKAGKPPISLEPIKAGSLMAEPDPEDMVRTVRAREFPPQAPPLSQNKAAQRVLAEKLKDYRAQAKAGPSSIQSYRSDLAADKATFRNFRNAERAKEKQLAAALAQKTTQPASVPSIAATPKSVKPPPALSVEDIPKAMAAEGEAPTLTPKQSTFSTKFAGVKNLAKGIGKGLGIGLAIELAPAAIASILGTARKAGGQDDFEGLGQTAVDEFRKSRQELSESRDFSQEQANKQKEQEILADPQYLQEILREHPAEVSPIEDLLNYGSALERALRGGPAQLIKSKKQLADEATAARFPEGIGEGAEISPKPSFQLKRYTTEPAPMLRMSGLLDIPRLKGALGSQESSGQSDAVGVDVGKGRGEAQGLWQVMPENVAAWGREYGFGEVTPERFRKDIKLQDAIVTNKLTEYAEEAAKKYPDNLDMQVREVARLWYGPKVNMESTKPYRYPGVKDEFPSMRNYTLGVLRKYAGGKPTREAEPVAEMSHPDRPLSPEQENKIRDVIASQVSAPQMDTPKQDMSTPWKLTGKTMNRPGSTIPNVPPLPPDWMSEPKSSIPNVPPLPPDWMPQPERPSLLANRISESLRNRLKRRIE